MPNARHLRLLYICTRKHQASTKHLHKAPEADVRVNTLWTLLLPDGLINNMIGVQYTHKDQFWTAYSLRSACPHTGDMAAETLLMHLSSAAIVYNPLVQQQALEVALTDRHGL